MRSFILVLLLVVINSISVKAQTTEDEEFISFRQAQVADYETLQSLDLITNLILEKYDDISHAGAYDRAILKLNAEEALLLVATMQDRGETMFEAVEQNYNQFCFQAVQGPRPCSAYKLTYRIMITDTLMFGTFYHTITDNLQAIIMSLAE